MGVGCCVGVHVTLGLTYVQQQPGSYYNACGQSLIANRGILGAGIEC